ncbi:MAG TPA: MlaD family protein, partial [Candidatus Binataceae bacterium]|nr:MlaD family protein [Candidatus Binataceae bacterium]
MRYCRALVLILCAILAACESHSDYTTRLSATRGLKPGDPVIREGRRIGTVNSVESMPDGQNEIAFAIEDKYVHEVRQDSAAVVTQQNGAPVLKLIATTNAQSPPAPPGTRVPGVATEGEASMLAAEGALKGFATNANEALNDLNATLEGVSKSPAWDELHRELQEIQQQIAKAGSQTRVIIDQHLPQLRR